MRAVMALPGYEGIPGLTEQIVKHHYQPLIDRLKQYHRLTNPAPAAKIAKAYGIAPSQVAALRRYAWRRGVPIGSCVKGYYYAHTRREWLTTYEHIVARVRAEVANQKMCEAIFEALPVDSSKLTDIKKQRRFL